jgi:hypothetical protein
MSWHVYQKLVASDTGIRFLSSIESSDKFEFIVGLPIVRFHFMDISLSNL